MICLRENTMNTTQWPKKEKNHNAIQKNESLKLLRERKRIKKSGRVTVHHLLWLTYVFAPDNAVLFTDLT